MSPRPKRPASRRISPSRSIGSACGIPFTASSTVDRPVPHRPPKQYFRALLLWRHACRLHYLLIAIDCFLTPRVGSTHQVDRPLRRAMLIIMRLSPPCFAIEVRAGLAGLLDPPCNPAPARSRAYASPARTASPASDKKNVHRVGRVSGGLLNPSGGARNRPRNKSVFAQRKNELNHNFASRNEIRLTLLKKVSPRKRLRLSRRGIQNRASRTGL